MMRSQRYLSPLPSLFKEFNMRRTFVSLAIFLLAQGIGSAHASDLNVGVSVSGEVAPGVYGRVDIGNSRPVLVYQQPVVIARPVRPVQPVYMHVPPGHAKKWSKHCRQYGACGVPVYFVKSGDYPRWHDHDRRHDDRDGRGRWEQGHDDHRGHHGHGHGRH
jgi:hypothetical protein